MGCSTFSVGDILEMDAEISKFPEFSMVESGPLILAWAVFLCLVLSLPESNANLVKMTFLSHTFATPLEQTSIASYYS